VLQSFVGTHSCPSFVRAAHIQSTLLTCTYTCYRTSWVPTVVLHSYMRYVCRHYRWLHSYTHLVCCQHCQPVFVYVAEPRWYPLLSYISTRCSSDVNIIDLYSYALQNLVGIRCCPTFVRAAHLPSTSSTCVRTHCRTSLVHTCVLHLYMLRVSHHYSLLHSYLLLICHQNHRPAFLHVKTSLVCTAALYSYVQLKSSQHR